MNNIKTIPILEENEPAIEIAHNITASIDTNEKNINDVKNMLRSYKESHRKKHQHINKEFNNKILSLENSINNLTQIHSDDKLVLEQRIIDLENLCENMRTVLLSLVICGSLLIIAVGIILGIMIFH